MQDRLRGLVARSNSENGEQSEGSTRAVYKLESIDEGQFGSLFYNLDEETFPRDRRVEVDVEYSSINYKDALCSTGHRGVAGKLPMIPGIDAAGEVVEGTADLPAGSKVIIGHAQFGTALDGGYCQRVRIPDSFCVPLPDDMSTREAMIYGTAGFTAAQSVERLVNSGVQPEVENKILITGATGGVGSIALMMLAELGYTTSVVTGKQDKRDWLLDLGATFVLGRDELPSAARRPLNSSMFAAAIDTVGGQMLANVISTIRNGGVVTACGMVAGVELPTSVYPFILRGVTLAGIDSANISRQERARVWDRLAADFRIQGIDRLTTEISLDELPERIEAILNGSNSGRVIVKIQ